MQRNIKNPQEYHSQRQNCHTSGLHPEQSDRNPNLWQLSVYRRARIAQYFPRGSRARFPTAEIRKSQDDYVIITFIIQFAACSESTDFTTRYRSY